MGHDDKDRIPLEWDGVKLDKEKPTVLVGVGSG